MTMMTLDDIAERLVRIEVKLDSQITGLQDHEGRIRTLEGAYVSRGGMYRSLLGFTALITAACAAVALLLH